MSDAPELPPLGDLFKKLPKYMRDTEGGRQALQWLCETYGVLCQDPLLAEIERLKHQLELAEHASVSQSQLYSEYQEEWACKRDELRAQLEAARKESQQWREFCSHHGLGRDEILAYFDATRAEKP